MRLQSLCGLMSTVLNNSVMRVSYLTAICIVFVSACRDESRINDGRARTLIDRCSQVVENRAADQVRRSDGNETHIAREAQAWEVGAGVVCFDGIIEHSTAEWFSTLPEEAKTLVIRSGGGNGQAAVDIAERLRAWESEIIVWDYCMSACAHFLFVGAARRIVPEPGVVGWHRSLPQTRFEALLLADSDLDDSFDPIVRHAFERYQQSGRSDIPDAVWRAVPASVRDSRVKYSDSRLRIQRLYAQAAIDPAILSAYNVIYRRHPDFIDQSEESGYYGLPSFWTPGETHLRAWGFDDLEMWEPFVCAASF